MSQRVKQVFPQLPVVLNPLQQARQQRDARLAGGSQDGPGRFAALVQQAVVAMPFALGTLESLDYDGETLRLVPVPGPASLRWTRPGRRAWPRPGCRRPSARMAGA